MIFRSLFAPACEDSTMRFISSVQSWATGMSLTDGGLAAQRCTRSSTRIAQSGRMLFLLTVRCLTVLNSHDFATLYLNDSPLHLERSATGLGTREQLQGTMESPERAPPSSEDSAACSAIERHRHPCVSPQALLQPRIFKDLTFPTFSVIDVES